jgi:MOSC domain-containing protein YiiM
MAKIVAVCTSREKGTTKEVIPNAVLREGYGLVGDAHADSNTHRQLSLLAMESINKMRSQGFDVGPGDFAENLTTQEIDLPSIPVGTRLSVGDEIILEISQIGKKCHSGCAIFQQTGQCIMPREGIFARVIHGGPVRTGDSIAITDDQNKTS